MAIIKSCCCWHSLRVGCFVTACYTLVYFFITAITMAHFVDLEKRYLAGELMSPESESFLQPEKITPLTIVLNICLLVCGVFGILSVIIMVVGVLKNKKYLLLPWIIVMCIQTILDVVNMGYLFYLQTLDFNPVTSFLFTMDFFIVIMNGYSLICVVSQYQELCAGRGTAESERAQRLDVVQFTPAAAPTTTSSALSGRRRSATRSLQSRFEPEEPSEIAPKVQQVSLLPPSKKSTVKKHVQFPDEESCVIDCPAILPPRPFHDGEAEEDGSVMSSLWMELETPALRPSHDR